MAEDKSPVPASELRASHEDRDRIAEQLRIAAGDGRLTMEELDERLEKALSARTGSELALLVTDLPTVASAPGVGLAVPAKAKELVELEVSSGSMARQGHWVVPRAMNIKVGSGSVKLDLTDAVISGPVLEIQAEVRSGSLTIITKPSAEGGGARADGAAGRGLRFRAVRQHHRASAAAQLHGLAAAQADPLRALTRGIGRSGVQRSTAARGTRRFRRRRRARWSAP